jgi:TPP-dependent pyruvate/acetoin dehydrogenase alpha subunit
VTHAGDNRDRDRILGHFRMMARIRAFEEQAEAAQKVGHVTGGIHQSIGQEAVAAGVCANLDAEDLLTSNHRGHGHALAKGADATAMMCELFGKAGGTCGGKGGSMHIADFAIGMLGANGVVGAGIPIAVGAAHALKIRGERRVVACFFGDGAVNRGPFLEGLNWAAVYALPVLFVCEDNGWAALTRTADLTAGPGIAARSESLGVPARTLDGNDVLAVDEAAADLAGAVRAGAGPRLLHARTYRLKGHTTADAGLYRSAEEVAAHAADEPIGRCRALLGQLGLGVADLDAIVSEAEAEMAAAAADAAAAPFPETALAFADVQDIPGSSPGTAPG